MLQRASPADWCTGLCSSCPEPILDSTSNQLRRHCDRAACVLAVHYHWSLPILKVDPKDLPEG